MALGDAEASGNLIEMPAPEAPFNTGPIQAIAPFLERTITHSLLYSVYFGLELEQRVRTCLGPAVRAAALQELRPFAALPDGAEGGAAFREVTEAGTARKPPSFYA